MSETKTPAEQLKSEMRSLSSQVGRLQDAVRLSSVRDAVEDVQTTVNNLDQQIVDLRTRGYVYGKGMEARAKDFEGQWAKLYPSIKAEIDKGANGLQAGMRTIDSQMSQLNARASNVAAARPMLNKLKADVEALERKADAAERSVNGMFDNLKRQVGTLTSELRKLDWTLTELSQASFQLLNTEAGVMAVKAVWARDGKEQKDDPEGVLFLTDQRLLFEQKEEVATKKVLFIATEKETVQQVLLEAPVVLVEAVKTDKRGMMKNEDFIEVNLANGAQVRQAVFHIWQDCEDWQALIQRAKAKEFDADRAVALDQEAVEKVRSAPSQCPACGGNLQQVILRGQDEIKCEYCGNVIRL